jgi:hypothetical protein
LCCASLGLNLSAAVAADAELTVSIKLSAASRVREVI